MLIAFTRRSFCRVRLRCSVAEHVGSWLDLQSCRLQIWLHHFIDAILKWACERFERTIRFVEHIVYAVDRAWVSFVWPVANCIPMSSAMAMWMIEHDLLHGHGSNKQNPRMCRMRRAHTVVHAATKNVFHVIQPTCNKPPNVHGAFVEFSYYMNNGQSLQMRTNRAQNTDEAN